jgi:hypothetical protein
MGLKRTGIKSNVKDSIAEGKSIGAKRTSKSSAPNAITTSTKSMSSTKKQCDALWAECVKARANNQSEISGKIEKLHAHHLRGKSSYRLRYDLDNGVCCTAGEHFFGFHVAGRREKYEQIIAKKRRKDLWEYLDTLKWEVCKTDISAVKVYLTTMLELLKKFPKESQ